MTLNPGKLLALTLIGVSVFGSIETSPEDPPAKDCNVTLNLSGVGLKTLPSGFVRNKFVTYLTLDDNDIPSVSTEAFTFVPNLNYLSLANNKLTTLNLSPFAQLHNLETLILSENCKAQIVQYEYVWHDNPQTSEEVVFCSLQFDSYLRNLTHLFAERNDVKKVSFGFGGLPRLTHLHLSHNPIYMNHDTMSGFNRLAPNLTHLELQNCSLSDFDLFHLPTITSLRLDDNRIHHICNNYCDDSFLLLNGAKNLETLTLSHNEILNINTDSFTHTTNLLELDLSHNKILKIREGTFSKLSKLRSLSLEDNKLSQLVSPDIFKDLISLEVLTLGANDISNITGGIFRTLTSLKQLMLNNNKISSIDSALFCEMVNLEMLNLAGNQLSRIPEGSLPISGLMVSLNLDDNKFTSTEDISLNNKPNMLSVSLRANPLETINAEWIMNMGSHNVTISVGRVMSKPSRAYASAV